MQTIFPILAILATVLASASLVLHKLAPKGKIPNEVLADIDAIKDALGTLGVKPLTAARKPQSGLVRRSLMALIAALGIGGAIALASCSGAQRSAEATTLETCGRTDWPDLLGALAAAFSQPSLAAAESSIASNSNLATLGKDTITCLTSVIVAARAAGSGDGSAMATSSRASDRALANAKAYLAKHSDD